MAYIPPYGRVFGNNYNSPLQYRAVAYGPSLSEPTRPPQYYSYQDKSYNNYANNHANNNTNNYSNDNYKNIESFQPLVLDLALEKSCYSSYNRDYIRNFLLEHYDNQNEAKVYLLAKEPKKTFAIEYTLSITLVNKPYKITLFVHIPELYPDYDLEFYLLKKPTIGLSDNYKNEKIDENTFKLNLNRFGIYDPKKTSIEEIINIIKNTFNKDFPIYSKKGVKDPEIFDKYNINKKEVNEIIIKSDKFTDDKFLKFMKKQVKDILKAEFEKYQSKCNINKNYQDLVTLNNTSKMKSGSSSNLNSNPMYKYVDQLNEIKQKLNQSEDSIKSEIQNLNSSNKSCFEKIDQLITIKDEKYMEYAIKKKIIEDYLIYLKKGYEKKIINFNDMINLTRTLTREVFSIDYLMSQRKF